MKIQLNKNDHRVVTVEIHDQQDNHYEVDIEVLSHDFGEKTIQVTVHEVENGFLWHLPERIDSKLGKSAWFFFDKR
jgi:hypothetical protein